MLDRKFFKKIRTDVVMKYRKHIFDPAGSGAKARDVFGKAYKAYKQSYKKPTGNLKRQSKEFANSKAPVLTGDLLKDYQFIKFLSNGFQFGFPTEGAKVKSLAQQGRVISTDKQPAPKSVLNFIMQEADKYVEKELGKNKGGTFNI